MVGKVKEVHLRFWLTFSRIVFLFFIAMKADTSADNNLSLQLLAYHLIVLRGHNVDQPRNLAKSVTTQ
ncbi:unnamed protein product [Coffea canephora]|uniref:DH200=94 genomic scaffold, scaffold_461 n=1 Tax=Coffea canephora TaxID=49390 RepID=A0A068VFQ4_COFCA|nr:unnamed protein product [Coffea canephora]